MYVLVDRKKAAVFRHSQKYIQDAATGRSIYAGEKSGPEDGANSGVKDNSNNSLGPGGKKVPKIDLEKIAEDMRCFRVLSPKRPPTELLSSSREARSSPSTQTSTSRPPSQGANLINGEGGVKSPRKNNEMEEDVQGSNDAFEDLSLDAHQTWHGLVGSKKHHAMFYDNRPMFSDSAIHSKEAGDMTVTRLAQLCVFLYELEAAIL